MLLPEYLAIYVGAYAGTYPCDDSEELLHLLTINVI